MTPSDKYKGFPGGSVIICLQHRRCGFNFWFRKILWRRKWQPTPVFMSAKFDGQRSLVDYSPLGCKRVGHDLMTKQQQQWQMQVWKYFNNRTFKKLRWHISNNVLVMLSMYWEPWGCWRAESIPKLAGIDCKTDHAQTLPSPCSMALCSLLEISHDGSICTTEISKYYKLGDLLYGLPAYHYWDVLSFYR